MIKTTVVVVAILVLFAIIEVAVVVVVVVVAVVEVVAAKVTTVTTTIIIIFIVSIIIITIPILIFVLKLEHWEPLCWWDFCICDWQATIRVGSHILTSGMAQAECVPVVGIHLFRIWTSRFLQAVWWSAYVQIISLVYIYSLMKETRIVNHHRMTHLICHPLAD